jgi:hypothetical protein
MITSGLERSPLRLAAAALAIALTAGPAAAHNPEPKVVRELVRTQGYRAPVPQGAQVVREVTLVVLGQQMRFAATEWRVFAFYDATGSPTPVEPAQLTLQGDRSELHPISSARR